MGPGGGGGVFFAADVFTAAVWCVPFSGTVAVYSINYIIQTPKKQRLVVKVTKYIKPRTVGASAFVEPSGAQGSRRRQRQTCGRTRHGSKIEDTTYASLVRRDTHRHHDMASSYRPPLQPAAQPSRRPGRRYGSVYAVTRSCCCGGVWRRPSLRLGATAARRVRPRAASRRARKRARAWARARARARAWARGDWRRAAPLSRCQVSHRVRRARRVRRAPRRTWRQQPAAATALPPPVYR